jgi:hypothetical protein
MVAPPKPELLAPPNAPLPPEAAGSVPPVPVAAPPTPAPPEPNRPPVPAPPLPVPVRPPVPFTPPVPGCAVPPLPSVPPWLGAPPVPAAPPVPDWPALAVVPPWLGTPPVSWLPPLPEEDELTDEQAVPRIASTATIEWTKRMGVMNASLPAECGSTGANQDILDFCVHTCNPRRTRCRRDLLSGARRRPATASFSGSAGRSAHLRVLSGRWPSR